MIQSLEQKLYTNSAPTKEEAIHIKKGLVLSEDKLHILHIKIHQLQGQLRTLRQQKKWLSKCIEGHRQLLAPIRRLNPDVLQEIFYHCLPTMHNSIMSSKESPLLLGRICRQWRQVAFTTPRLWNSIHIVTPKSNLPYTEPANYHPVFLSAISSWLSRSGTLPLSISFHSTFDHTSNFVLRPYLKLFIPLMSRWKSIHFRFLGYDWSELFDLCNAAALPQLERLRIGGIPGGRDDFLSSIRVPAAMRKDGMLCAPRLRSLSIPGYGPTMLQLPLRWNSLTELDLGDIHSLPDILNALSLCPNLEICSIFRKYNSETGDFINPIHPIHLTRPRLRVLRVHEERLHRDPHLFEYLNAPKLLHLTYTQSVFWEAGEEEDNEVGRIVHALKSLLGEMNHSLQELHLDTGSLVEPDVMEFLKITPELKRLSLTGRALEWGWGWSNFELTDKLLKGLIPSSFSTNYPTVSMASTGAAVPNLSSEAVDLSFHLQTSHGCAEINSATCLCPKLEVFNCTGATSSESAVLDFLRSRSLDYQSFGVTRLQRAAIKFSRGQTESMNLISEVKALEEETGLITYITYQSHLPAVPAPAWGLYTS